MNKNIADKNIVDKKLIVLIGSLEIGGTEQHLLNVLPKIANKGWNIEVITLTRKGILADPLEAQGVKVTLLLNPKLTRVVNLLPALLKRPLRIFLTLITLMIRFRKEKKSLLHFYLPESYVLGMIAALMAKFTGPKIMSRRSLNYYQQKRPLVASLEKKLHSKAWMILGNSQAILNELQKEGVDSARLRLIYNGIDLNRFLPDNLPNFQTNISAPLNSRSSIEMSDSYRKENKESKESKERESKESKENKDPIEHSKDPMELRKTLGIPKEAWVMVILANLIPYKGHSELLMALNLIQNQLPSGWYLLCVGRDDGIGETLREKAKEYGLTDRILWLGSRRDIPNLLSIADLGILTSHTEGFSNAILECMASKLPMVVTDVGGNKEAVIEGITGRVVPVKAIDLLSKAILELSTDRMKAKAFGEAAFERVEQQFSLEGCVEAYVELYEMLYQKAFNKMSDYSLCVD